MSWDNLYRDTVELQSAVKKSTAVNVNSKSLKESAKALVQLYFRNVRPELAELGIEDAALDLSFQGLLSLANANNARTSYSKVLGSISSSLRSLEGAREVALGAQVRRGAASGMSKVDERIVQTLDAIVPTAALSYRQAMVDLGAASRLSYRGTANELREAMREAIDFLAPDDQVTAQPQFKLEKDQKKPTTVQKVRFIFKQRATAKHAVDTTERTASLVDELTASLARQVSTRSSKATHTISSKNEVATIKLYVERVLCEILEVPVTD